MCLFSAAPLFRRHRSRSRVWKILRPALAATGGGPRTPEHQGSCECWPALLASKQRLIFTGQHNEDETIECMKYLE